MFLDKVFVSVPKYLSVEELCFDLNAIGLYVENVWSWNGTRLNSPVEYSVQTVFNPGALYLKFFQGRITTATTIELDKYSDITILSWEKFLSSLNPDSRRRYITKIG